MPQDNNRTALSDEKLDKAVKNASASLAMEGMIVTSEEEQITRSYMKGEVPIEDIIADIRKKYEG